MSTGNARYFFVGDGTEVLSCHTYQSDAIATAGELRRADPDNAGSINVYECDPNEVAFPADGAQGAPVWAYPAERAAAESAYDMPTMDECLP